MSTKSWLHQIPVTVCSQDGSSPWTTSHASAVITPTARCTADAVLATDVAVMSDEIYEQLVYGDNQATCFATLRPELPERTVTISGVSKTYAMTGWRIGWAVGPTGLTG